MKNAVSDKDYEEELAKWQPKIQGMARKAHVPFMEPEDLAQELMMVLFKCMGAYDEGNGASFHTFFHSACWNKIFTLTRDVNRHRGNGSENTMVYLDEISVSAGADPLEGLSRWQINELPFNRRLVDAFSVAFDEPIELVLELQGFKGLEVTYVRGRMDLLTVAETAKAYEVPEGELRGVANAVRSKVAKLRSEVS